MGLASLLLGDQNPFAQWTGQNSNLLGALGAGLASGPDFSSGIAQGLQMAPQAKAMDFQMAEKKKADAKVEAQINSSTVYLRKKHPDLAAMVEAGMPINEAWNEAMRREQPQAAPAPIKVGAGDTLLDPNTYQPVYTAPAAPGDNKDAFNYEKDLTSQYLGTDPVKSYQTVRNGYEKVRTAAQSDSGPGDISMIFAYMKMLDPTSVVREGEFATAENAGGVGQQITNLYNRLITGERLTPELRKQFLAAAEKMYADTSSNLGDINQQFSTRAGAWGVDPSHFIINPETYQPMRIGARKTIGGKNYVQDENGDWYEE